MPSHFPLLCGFRDLVEGKLFLAEVRATGRAIAVEESDGWWINGVNPGAIAVGGKTLNEAVLLLRESFTKVLFDLVAEARDFDEFKGAVEKFFREVDQATLEEWESARAAVRAGKVQLAGLPAVRTDDTHFSVAVLLRGQTTFDPKKNRVPEDAKVAA
jgi:hypothetical protein